MYRRKNIRTKKCPDEKMYRRKNVQTKKCTDEKMYRRKNARRKKVGRKSADEKLSDEKMSDEILSGHVKQLLKCPIPKTAPIIILAMHITTHLNGTLGQPIEFISHVHRVAELHCF